MTTKQRAYLKGLAMTMDPIFQLGKSSLTRNRRDTCRENTVSGCSGNRKENRSLQRRKRR